MIILMAVALLWTGCKGREDFGSEQDDSFALSICLPANEVRMASSNGPRRVMGDPGTQEQFVLPKYIYIYVVKEGTLFYQITIDDATEYWRKEYYSGSMMGSGDSIYRYTRDIIKQLAPGAEYTGSIYTIVSAEELTITPALTSGTSTEEDVLNLKFQTAGIQSSLQHIYTTPYNYEIEDKYYGSFQVSKKYKVPYVNLMLYHVAAKVDINWNVADSARVKADGVTPIRLTTMKACNLFNGDAYCFKPMKNVYDSETPLASGAEVSIVTPTDEGLWWEGRSYFYTIPYTTRESDYENYFPLQMQMETNESGDTYTPTIYMQIDKSDPFVPWLRATFNIKNPLPAGSATKKVDWPTP